MVSFSYILLILVFSPLPALPWPARSSPCLLSPPACRSHACAPLQTMAQPQALLLARRLSLLPAYHLPGSSQGQPGRLGSQGVSQESLGVPLLCAPGCAPGVTGRAPRPPCPPCPSPCPSPCPPLRPAEAATALQRESAPSASPADPLSNPFPAPAPPPALSAPCCLPTRSAPPSPCPFPGPCAPPSCLPRLHPSPSLPWLR